MACLLLQMVVDTSAQRLVALANQWEKHRAPLIEQYRQLRDFNSKKEVGAFCFNNCPIAMEIMPWFFFLI